MGTPKILLIRKLPPAEVRRHTLWLWKSFESAERMKIKIPSSEAERGTLDLVWSGPPPKVPRPTLPSRGRLIAVGFTGYD